MPGFLIIGVQRGGTTSLFDYLSKHPNILPPFRKEIKFFDFNFKLGKNWYQANFPLQIKLRLNHAISGEASPNYIFHPNGLKRIAMTIPGIKIILILRNPVNRAYSQYHLMVAEGKEKLSFEDATRGEEERLRGEAEKIAADPNYSQENFFTHSYLARGRYIEQVPALNDLFPRQNILILKSEDLYTQPADIYHQTLAFLELPLTTLPHFDISNEGEYSPMLAGTRSELVKYFKPYNEKLYQYLGRDFGWE